MRLPRFSDTVAALLFLACDYSISRTQELLRKWFLLQWLVCANDTFISWGCGGGDKLQKINATLEKTEDCYVTAKLVILILVLHVYQLSPSTVYPGLKTRGSLWQCAQENSSRNQNTPAPDLALVPLRSLGDIYENDSIVSAEFPCRNVEKAFAVGNACPKGLFPSPVVRVSIAQGWNAGAKSNTVAIYIGVKGNTSSSCTVCTAGGWCFNLLLHCIPRHDQSDSAGYCAVKSIITNSWLLFVNHYYFHPSLNTARHGLNEFIEAEENLLV
ncbi:hypothetical protein RRG08_050924 [Elysia crispata]|uniref:Uncharacterized protein n=1 Tax=Elysia crispata TaxID=231223 RepID=A0AAE1D2L5_9GAST|nr:hypothetical protein RRG08_050924 [Elysia crispata]